ncbi:MAG: ComEA family DNA-binding protein [Methylococcales bacterium]|nr:ComEA family DNA-binding protein [Methylococcales bacterium]
MTKKLFMFMLLFSANVFAAPVNINTADAQKIADSLKMIGEKKAQSIIEYRVKNGQFKNVDDLKKVAGIGDKIIDKNKEDILFSDSLTSMTPVKK